MVHASAPYSDCQMSHCFLFEISQVENHIVQAPEREGEKEKAEWGNISWSAPENTCWLDALSTAEGLFVSWAQRTWQPTPLVPPSASDSHRFSLVLARRERQCGRRKDGGVIETKSYCNHSRQLKSPSTLMLHHFYTDSLHEPSFNNSHCLFCNSWLLAGFFFTWRTTRI